MKEQSTALLSVLKEKWWQLLLLGLLGCLALNVSASFQDQMDKFVPEAIINCSSRNSKASGYRAFFELLQRTGIKCHRFEQPYRQLASESGVLVIAGPSTLIKPHEIEKVLDWVKKGNNLVLLDNCLYGSGQQILEHLRVQAHGVKMQDEKRFSNLPQHALMQHVPALVLLSMSRLSGGEILLKDEAGALIVELKHGKGRCLIATAPSFCSNSRISDRSNWGNFQFLCNWLSARDGQVLFDERVHGYSNAQNIFVYVLRGPVAFIILQISVIFTFVLLSQNQRFGPALSLKSERKISSSEHIDGMALTYERAKAYAAAFAILYGSFHSKLCKTLAVSSEESSEELAKRWAEAEKLDLQKTNAFLTQAEALSSASVVRPEQLLEFVKAKDELCQNSNLLLAGKVSRQTGY